MVDGNLPDGKKWKNCLNSATTLDYQQMIVKNLTKIEEQSLILSVLIHQNLRIWLGKVIVKVKLMK